MTAKETAAMQTLFSWQASESAPKNYPMQVVAGSVGGSYVPHKVTLHHGWGWGRSSHVGGSGGKLPPNRLGITFFSYTEDQFYSDSFDLPYDKILALFRAGYESPTDKGWTTYGRVIVGVAPGGAVSVWLEGTDKITEVFFGQADKVEGDWQWINNNPDYPRKEYIRLGIEETLAPEVIADHNKNGIPFGRWEKYHRARYVWQPLFTGMDIRNGQIDLIKYFNGEKDYLDYPLDDALAATTSAVPCEIVFVWLNPPAKPLRIKLFFDEAEIFELFEKLGGNNQPLKLEMRLGEVGGDSRLTILLCNDKDEIEFDHIRAETYGVPVRID